jgi:hypothetical protein
MQADESTFRTDQHSTGISAVEQAKPRPIRFRVWQKDHPGLHVEVHSPAGCARPGRTLSDSFLQVFEVECHLRSLPHNFRQPILPVTPNRRETIEAVLRPAGI